jgi:hypothetical protein
MPMIYKTHNYKVLFFISFLLLISCSRKDKKIETNIEVSAEKTINLDSTHLREGVSLRYPSEFDSILVYTVQIGAFKTRNTFIEKSPEVQSIKEEDSLIKYRFGNFKNYSEATILKKSAQQLYPDAFIVPIHKGIRINITQALELSNEVTKD